MKSYQFTSEWIAKMQSDILTHRIIISKSIPEQKINSRSRQAAVLIPLCNRHSVASFLFTIRSDKVSTHKSQVSFPGGHLETGETAVEAALREAREELGADIGNIRVLGVCQTIPAITGTLVTPVLGFIERDVADFDHFTPSVDEVSRVFSRSVEQLIADDFKTYRDYKRNGMTLACHCTDRRMKNRSGG